MPKEKKQPERDRPGQVYCAVHLSTETVTALDEHAQHEGRKRAQMIRRILDQYLAANPLEVAAR